jgi:DNA-binding GntR family transcriptional regulator
MSTSGSVTDVRDTIRAAILNGEFAPGTVLPQGPLAQRLGVSRTPMREALRMLQEDGLVEIERNRRARVATFDADDLELVYASRILLSAVATRLTVPQMGADDLVALRAAYDALGRRSKEDDLSAWRAADRQFHRLHCAKAPASLLRELDALFERAALFRLLRLRDAPHRQAVNASDHDAILAACEARDGPAAAAAVARHLSRIALTILAYTAPEREPLTIRTALQLALGS